MSSFYGLAVGGKCQNPITGTPSASLVVDSMIHFLSNLFLYDIRSTLGFKQNCHSNLVSSVFGIESLFFRIQISRCIKAKPLQRLLFCLLVTLCTKNSLASQTLTENVPQPNVLSRIPSGLTEYQWRA